MTTFSECMFSEEMMVLSLHSSLLGISSSVSPLWLHNMSEVWFSIPTPHPGHLSIIFIHSLKINRESEYAFPTLHFLHCHIFPKIEKNIWSILYFQCFSGSWQLSKEESKYLTSSPRGHCGRIFAKFSASSLLNLPTQVVFILSVPSGL